MRLPSSSSLILASLALSTSSSSSLSALAAPVGDFQAGSSSPTPALPSGNSNDMMKQSNLPPRSKSLVDDVEDLLPSPLKQLVKDVVDGLVGPLSGGAPKALRSFPMPAAKDNRETSSADNSVAETNKPPQDSSAQPPSPPVQAPSPPADVPAQSPQSPQPPVHPPLLPNPFAVPAAAATPDENSQPSTPPTGNAQPPAAPQPPVTPPISPPQPPVKPPVQPPVTGPPSGRRITWTSQATKDAHSNGVPPNPPNTPTQRGLQDVVPLPALAGLPIISEQPDAAKP
ncbi:hypothetical protein B0F90DRAFT_1664701 [Multifurca ochricompacta]|uniref:Uncharacterized protein n=1 Tax=Multifurca ochricompacta TaxID=376703 RepID=A0AAD4MCJ5_9AGAM|nr:hypothetical protein B0F90DRAFT_1664701 [Multifurca ochricompacta]